MNQMARVINVIGVVVGAQLGVSILTLVSINSVNTDFKELAKNANNIVTQTQPMFNIINDELKKYKS
jgi:hypothetical protein